MPYYLKWSRDLDRLIQRCSQGGGRTAEMLPGLHDLDLSTSLSTHLVLSPATYSSESPTGLCPFPVYLLWSPACLPQLPPCSTPARPSTAFCKIKRPILHPRMFVAAQTYIQRIKILYLDIESHEKSVKRAFQFWSWQETAKKSKTKNIFAIHSQNSQYLT